jgi:hypothetical protein
MTIAVASALIDYPTHPYTSTPITPRAFTAPNLRRFDIPQRSNIPWTGIIRDLEDLVERVMKVHTALTN